LFSYIMPWIGAVTGKRTNEVGTRRIRTLQKQLVELGYNPEEVGYMVQQLCNNRKLEQLTAEEIVRVGEALNEQLSIARQCIDLVLNNRAHR